MDTKGISFVAFFKNNQREVETKTGISKLREDGILEFHYKDGARDTLEDAEATIKAQLKMLGRRRPVPLLVVLGNIKSQTKEARACYMDSEGAKVASRIAFLVSSKVRKTIGNIFLGLTQIKIPMRMFSNKSEALRWLKSGSKT